MFRRFLILLGFIAINVSAQSIDSTTGTVVFSTSTLTNVYTASSSVDLQSYDSVSVIAATVTTQNHAIATLKPQWSQDNVSWVDESYLLTNASSGFEQPYSIFSKAVTITLTNSAPSYVEAYPRQGRYFRTLVKSTNAFTTGTIKITVQKMNNTSK